MRSPKLPKDWRKTPLSLLSDVQTGIAKGKRVNGSPISLPYLRVANVQDGYVDLSVIKEIMVEQADVERYRLRDGDVLFTEGGDFDKLGRGTVWQGQIAPCLHQNHVFAVRPKAALLLPEFLAYQAASEYGRRYFQLSSKQSTNLASINSTQLREFPILLPPLPEQHKIAEILRTWDEAIEKLEALRAAKQKKLSSLRQKLFGLSGQFRSEWPLKPLSELSNRVQRQNSGNNYPVMTISAKSGFLLQSDKYSRDMAGRSLENYIVLHEGEFAYNKGNSLTYPQGCIFPLERPAALVPHVYFCFALKKGLNQNFYAHLFDAGVLNRQLTRLINSGVRNDGLLNINAADFFGCRLPVPSLEAQQTMATALTTAKEELTLLDAELEALTRQKRGLMQKLLTGEWRVRA